MSPARKESRLIAHRRGQHGSLQNARMPVQDALHLLRADVLASGNDDVLRPVPIQTDRTKRYSSKPRAHVESAPGGPTS